MPDDFISSDAASVSFPKDALKTAVKGTRREQLEAIRDYIANELEIYKCSTCTGSKLRSGDQASLILRLQTVLAELDSLGDGKKVNRLASVRSLHTGDGQPAPEAELPTTSPNEQRRTGSRRPGGGRWAGA